MVGIIKHRLHVVGSSLIHIFITLRINSRSGIEQVAEDPKGMKQHENGDNCIIWSFINRTLYQILLARCKQDWRDM
jgi:hypothetical protein